MTDENISIDDNKKLSQFNAGVAKAIRLNELITRYNNASTNPLAYDYDLHNYNYIIMFETARRLFKEAIGKADEDERKNCMIKIRAIEMFLERYNIMEKKSTESNQVNLNVAYWNILKEKLDDLENDIRIVLDEHDLDSPTKKKYMGL